MKVGRRLRVKFLPPREALQQERRLAERADGDTVGVHRAAKRRKSGLQRRRSIADNRTMESKLPSGLQEDAGSHRRFRRCKVALEAIVWPVESDVTPEQIDSRMSITTRVFVEDISLTGLFLISLRSFPPDTELWVRLRLGPQVVLLEAAIRRIEEVDIADKHCFGLGAQLVRGDAVAQAIPVIADYVDKLRKIEMKSMKRAA